MEVGFKPRSARIFFLRSENETYIPERELTKVPGTEILISPIRVEVKQPTHNLQLCAMQSSKVLWTFKINQYFNDTSYM